MCTLWGGAFVVYPFGGTLCGVPFWRDPFGKYVGVSWTTHHRMATWNITRFPIGVSCFSLCARSECGSCLVLSGCLPVVAVSLDPLSWCRHVAHDV